MHLPTGVLVHDGRLIVADAWHHRILVWDNVPTVSDTAPDRVIGSPMRPRWRSTAARSARGHLYWPFGIAVVGGAFW